MSWLSRLFGGPPPPALAPSRLIVGLGNPGPDYVGTRHNAGFMVVDRLAERLGADLSTEAAHAFVGEVTVPAEGDAEAVVLALAKPLTFMNRSARAVTALLDRYGLDVDDLLIVYDDLALPVGGLRLRGKGSHGGHNGIRDLIQTLGSTEFPRLRVGVGNSFPPGRQVDFVLSPFDDAEEEAVSAALDDAADAALTFARDGLTAAMNRHNRR
ncbi:aminoacyl-tRNA hydrolase [Rubrivirga sp. SAORIC476]|uniref:aminoacyl-tRNA hydrolase n=1 Tax=Rubrivirga sp. SAORIC476 TaxID=1961794 RepID=UPI0018E9789B|nr:aminoacyl-tRNA hydrolase [Rubrivirga sp. SAORIC476]